MTRALAIAAIVATLAVIIAITVAVSVIKHAIRQHGIGNVIWWFVSGHHFGGKRHCCEKHCTPGVRWRRARRRLAPFAMLAGAGAVMLMYPASLALAGSVGAVCGLAVLYPVRAVRVAQVIISPAVSAASRHVCIPGSARAAILTGPAARVLAPAGHLIALTRHRHEVVQPMAIALAPVLEMTARETHRALSIPARWQKPDAQISVKVLPAWSATLDRQQFIEREVAQRFPGVEWDARYQLRGMSRRVLFTPLPEPPRVVPLEQVLAAVEAAQQGKPVIGIDSRGNLVYIDLDKETPHVGLSIGTGGGKSDFLKLIIMQLITKGVERIVIIDPKGGSQKWAEDEIGRVIVPGIEIYYDLEDQWQAIENFRSRMESDYRKWRSDRRQQFTREVLILEEQNDFAAETSAHWKKIRSRKDPAMPPPFDHSGRILFKGRQANRNIISVYQRMSVQATGGLGDIRDQYGTKIMGRFSPAAWDSLVGTRPRGKSSTIPGRMISITGPDHRLIQAPWATDAEALDYVFSHGVARVPQGMSPVVHPAVDADQEDRGQGTGDRAVKPLRLITSRFTLREHATRGTVPMAYENLRKARQRAQARGEYFPDGVDGTYTVTEIQDWYRSSGREAGSA